MQLKRLFLLLLVFIGLNSSYILAQTSLADEIKTQLEDFPSSKKKYVINHIASFHTILEIEKNNRNDTIRVRALNTHRSFFYTDSIIIYNFTYTPYGNIEHIKIEDEIGNPAYFGIYDSDIRYSSLHFYYDISNREIGYEMFSDSILIEKQYIIENLETGTITVYTLKRKYSIQNNEQTYTLEAFRTATINRNEKNQILSFEEKLFNSQFNGGNIKSYRFYKFDTVSGKVIEEPFSLFGNMNVGIENYERIVYQYDVKGNIISWRKCDYRYVLCQPEPPISKEEFNKRKEVFQKQKEEMVNAKIFVTTKRDLFIYQNVYLQDSYEDYLLEEYLPYLESWNDETVMALYLYSKNGKKIKSKIYLNYKGEIIYQEN